MSKFITHVCVCILACATLALPFSSKAQTSDYSQTEKTNIDIAAAKIACGNKNYIDDKFDITGKTKTDIYLFYGCMADKAADFETLWYFSEYLWDQVFDGKITSQQASQKMDLIIAKTTENMQEYQRQKNQEQLNFLNLMIAMQPITPVAPMPKPYTEQNDDEASAVSAPSVSYGNRVYNQSDCIGAVVNGICHGTVNPSLPYQTCHGEMLNGMCTGPMF